MKYQKVKALIVGFVFSVSTMTACGVYGGMETEEAAVYGSYEDMTGTEQAFWDVPDDRESICLDVEDMTDSFGYHGMCFPMPSYMKQVEEMEDGSIKFNVGVEDESEDSQLIFQYVSFKETFPEQADAEWDSYEKIIEFASKMAEEKNAEEQEVVKSSGGDADSVITDWIEYDIYDFDENTYPIFRILTDSEQEQSQWYCGMIPMDDGDHFIIVKLVENSGSTYLYEEDLRTMLFNVGEE